ncbi:hypothetical protein COU77_00685, partial [Candidatus Peregrinibacteria bacterium CG10_big_fil_rev_8_21_14_0_10_49_16]
RLGVLQQYLLKQVDTDRLLGSRDVLEAEKILTELPCTDVLDQSLLHVGDILPALEQWLQREVRVAASSQKQHVFDILWLEGDSALLSYFFKEQKGWVQSTGRELLPGMSAYRKEELLAVVRGEKKDAFPEIVRCMVELRTHEGGPMEADFAIANAVNRVQVRLAEESASREILSYVRLQIDIRNLRTALRLVQKTIDSAPLFLSGGTLPEAALASGDFSVLQAALDRSSFGFGFTHSLQEFAEDPTLYQRETTQVMQRHIAFMWNKTLSIEPLFAFAATVLSQLFFLRAVFIAKRNELSPQELRDILPPFLSGTHYVVS